MWKKSIIFQLNAEMKKRNRKTKSLKGRESRLFATVKFMIQKDQEKYKKKNKENKENDNNHSKT